MEKLYSLANKNKLLHIIIRKDDFSSRKDVIPPNEFLQLALIKLDQDQTFKAHQHIYKKNLNTETIAQEAWVIIHGKVKVDFYDINKKYLKSFILSDGDCTITLYGGHNYTCLESNTFVYEFKTGPYFGVEQDKELID